MKRGIIGLFLSLILILSYCLLSVTPVAADDSNNGSLVHSVSSNCQFEGYLWYLSDTNYGTFEGTIEVMDDGMVTGSFYKSYIVCQDPNNMVYGYFTAGRESQEVIEAEIVEVDGKQAVWALMKTVTSGTIYCSQSQMASKYRVALIVDGHNPHHGEDYILGIEGIDGENQAKSIYDNYLATGDISGLLLLETAECNIVIE